MEKFFSEEERKYLRKLSNYVQSYGLENATITVEILWRPYPNDYDVNKEIHFDGNPSAEIPELYKVIIKKIESFIADNDLWDGQNDEYFYQSISYILKTQENKIVVVEDHGKYVPHKLDTISYILSEQESIYKKILRFEKTYLGLGYQGSGDSGYIENEFDDGNSVPSSVEEWCYDVLEENYGGWEINEGSNGLFQFDVKNDTINLIHYQNVEENFTKVIFSASF